MFCLEKSDYSIYNEYLQCKYKDKSIKVVTEELTNTTHTTLVYYSSDRIKGFTLDEIEYNNLWIIIRKLKINNLKKKIYENCKK